jgi:hypothetical protein
MRACAGDSRVRSVYADEVGTVTNGRWSQRWPL